MIDTKALREKILDLAMRGKLVPQDPNDEPASELLKRIKAKKEELIKAKKIKRDKNETEIFVGDDNLHYEKFPDGSIKPIDVPYELPEGWSITYFKNVAKIVRGGSPRPIKSFLTDQEDGINWIKIGDTQVDDKFIRSTSEKIIPEGLKKTRMVHPGDFLLSNSMSFGRPYILKIDGAIHDGWLAISDYNEVFDIEFLYYLISSKYVQRQFLTLASGTAVKNLNSDKVAATFVLIPPLNEQVKIVAKVNDLLSALELIQQEQEELVKLSNLLKQKTLEVAMQGKLLPQDSTDEPASVLLEKIREEKQQLYKEGKLKKKDLEESEIILGDDNVYYENNYSLEEDSTYTGFYCPPNWVGCELKDIIYNISTKKYQIKQSEVLESGIFPVVSQSSKSIEGYFNSKDKLFSPRKPVVIFGDHTRVVKLLSEPFVVGADGVKIIVPIYIKPSFLKISIEYILLSLKDRGYGRHYSYLVKKYIAFPNIDTQNLIVKKFNQLERLVQQFT